MGDCVLRHVAVPGQKTLRAEGGGYQGQAVQHSHGRRACLNLGRPQQALAQVAGVREQQHRTSHGSPHVMVPVGGLPLEEASTSTEALSVSLREPFGGGERGVRGGVRGGKRVFSVSPWPTAPPGAH